MGHNSEFQFEIEQEYYAQPKLFFDRVKRSLKARFAQFASHLKPMSLLRLLNSQTDFIKSP